MIPKLIEDENMSPETIWEIMQSYEDKDSNLLENLEENLQKIANGLQDVDVEYFKEEITKIRNTVTALSEMEEQEIIQNLEDIREAFSVAFD